MFCRRNYIHKILLLTGMVLCLLAGPALAEVTFPEYYNKYVNDYAKVLTPSDAEALVNMLENLDRQTGIEMTVVTITALADQGATGLPLKTYAAGLFDTWGVGNREKNDGVMLLFSAGDRQVWIEMGLSYAGRLDASLQSVVDNAMLPRFRNNEYSRGLYEGAAGVVGVLTGTAPAVDASSNSGASGGQPVYNGGGTTKEGWIVLAVLVGLIILFIAAGISMIRKGKKGWGFVFFGIAGAILFFLLRALFSGKKGGGGGFGGGRSGGGGAGGSW